MALNKFMHPRNIYKTPPDFAKLAKEFKEFSEIAKVDVSGKFSIDFKNPNSLCVLTKCLLKSDFNISIDIPEDRLVPTLPLRLNYILWIEDLLSAIQRSDSVIGLDIGTGACAIYPILAAVKNKWHMVGTESDQNSFDVAMVNVKKNNLIDMIQLRKNETSSVIDFILQKENTEFHFCMCNPPFYSTFQDLWESRSPARPPPKNGFTGSPQELITEGGELQFCRKIIDESKNHKDKILIFTTMVGHKFNLKELVLDMKAEGIKYTTTEFCQGRVTRWGLAWTFQAFEINKLVSPKVKARKTNAPINFTLPKLPDEINDIQTTKEKFETILQNLKIEYKIVNKRKHEVTLDILAPTNTWSNQRRKRRLLKRIQDDEMKRSKLNTEDMDDTGSKAFVEDTSTKEVCSEKMQTEEKIEVDPIVHAVLHLRNKSDNISVELEYLDGSAGKEGIHQIVQYIKNNWK